MPARPPGGTTPALLLALGLGAGLIAGAAAGSPASHTISGPTISGAPVPEDAGDPVAGPAVQVTGGAIAGRWEGADAVFQGIPFAAPPVGGLRWRAPQPVKAWTGVLDATREAPACPQRDFGWNHDSATHTSEDCLTLDIRSPDMDRSGAPTGHLPVMVWIHGGANWAGSARGVVFSPITRRGVVLVAIQYRLDALGFLSHPALTAASPHHASGNYGLMDQIAALRWVRANIARFGGDPGQVTLFGESAGAQDVGQLMLSPLARGLFARAIEESGTAGFGQPPRSLAENERIGVDLARLAHLPDPAGPRALAALRVLPADQVLAIAAHLVPPAIEDPTFLWLQAVTDGHVLPETPARTLSAGRQARVPLLIGVNARELPLHGGDSTDNARHWLIPAFDPHAGEALRAYGLDGAGTGHPDPLLGSPADQVADDITFRCPTLTVARRQAAEGLPVWVYQFERTVVTPGATPTPVSHGSDLRYVFDDPPGNAGLQAYWVNFARTGNPNASELPRWPAFRDAPTAEGGGAYMAFTNHGPQARNDLRGGICTLFDRP